MHSSADQQQIFYKRIKLDISNLMTGGHLKELTQTGRMYTPVRYENTTIPA